MAKLIPIVLATLLLSPVLASAATANLDVQAQIGPNDGEQTAPTTKDESPTPASGYKWPGYQINGSNTVQVGADKQVPLSGDATVTAETTVKSQGFFKAFFGWFVHLFTR